MEKIPVTVIIPVKNEELNLPNCLKLLTKFNQIIVIDSFSTDKTPEIAKQFNTEYVQFKWNGKFPKKRNWALQNLNIKNDWVLFLDADEYLTENFISELQDKINDKSFCGFWVLYNNYFMGKELKHGDKMKKLPLFRKGSGEYEKIEEDNWSHLDMEIHEHPIIQGKTGKFKNYIIHNDYKGLEHYIARHNAYSTWEANRYIKLKQTGFNGLTVRQKIKYGLLNTGFLPVFYFLGAFLLKFGFLDGKSGYYLAKYKSQYFFQIQTKIKELKSETRN
jgi:glycosyltransferase involved in cell wall biosynthesis